ncbi:MAG: PadR family transcriptional regulator [Pseudoxanthomonas sp.]
MRFPFSHDARGHDGIHRSMRGGRRDGREGFDPRAAQTGDDDPRVFDRGHRGYRGDDRPHGDDAGRGSRRFAIGLGGGRFRRGFGPFDGDGFAPPSGDGRGGPRGGRRPFEQGDLRWLALDLIAEQPRHGYEIIRAVEELMHGQYSPSPGVVYPTLTWLEETGLIAGEAEGARKRYSITEAGRAELAANAAQVQAVRERLQQASARFGSASPPELHRALGNLRAALQVRLSKGTLDAAAVATITAALDEAARRIEQA